ncbi:MAG: DUF4145 domain-containing protein [Rhodoplanes sp.]
MSLDEFLEESIAGRTDFLDPLFSVEGCISIKDIGAAGPPDYVPATAFREGATFLVVGNWNATGAMFRLAIDLTTKPMLPTEDVPGLNDRMRRDLGLRLPWLFDNGLLPSDLRELSSCVREDGDYGVHAGTHDGGCSRLVGFHEGTAGANLR